MATQEETSVSIPVREVPAKSSFETTGPISIGANLFKKDQPVQNRVSANDFVNNIQKINPYLQDVVFDLANHVKGTAEFSPLAEAIKNTYGYNKPLDMLANPTGVKWLDEAIDKTGVREMSRAASRKPLPDITKFEENPFVKTMSEVVKASDYLGRKYQGETFESLTNKAFNADSFANDMAQSAIAGPMGNAMGSQASSQAWDNVADFMTHKIVRGFATNASPILAGMAGHPEISTALIAEGGASAAGAKYAELRKNAPDMPEESRIQNALMTGALQFIMQKIALNMTAVGAKIVAEAGVNIGSSIIHNSIMQNLQQGMGEAMAKAAGLEVAANTLNGMANYLAQSVLDNVYHYNVQSWKDLLYGLMESGIISASHGLVIQSPAALMRGYGEALQIYKATGNQSVLPRMDDILLDQAMVDIVGNGYKDIPSSVLTKDQALASQMLEEMYKGGLFSEDVRALENLRAAAKNVKDKIEGEEGYVRMVMGYSTLEDVVNSKIPGRATPEQILRTLEGAGVSKEEVQDMDLFNWLKDKEIVTKKELQDYLEGNDIQIQEVQKGQIVNDRARQQAILTATNKRDVASAKLAQKGVKIEQDVGGEPGDVLVGDMDTGKFFDIDEGTPKEIVELVDQFSDAEKELDDLNNGGPLKPAAKFAQYTLSGGENYREVLLTIQKQVSDQDLKDYIGKDPYLKQEYEAGRFSNRDMEDIKNGYRLRRQDAFKSNHWDEPNVLAHVRLNDRMIDGKKTLFIEEVQSDWHQKGRDKGYKNELSPEEQEKYYALEKQLSGVEENQIKNDRAIRNIKSQTNYFDDSEIQKELEYREKLAEDLSNVFHEIQRDIEAIHNYEGVPNAPFKKTWHELALKKILGIAAKEGYDKIAWTTGEQQAGRYDLSKQVDAVRITGDPKQGLTIEAAPKGEPYRVIAPEVAASEIDKYVGKDIARKYNETGQAEYKGVDLKVGGEGMKSFYDSMIPQYLNKYTKKWGGRSGVDEIETKPGKYETVHSLEITPFMKKALSKGQPIYGSQARPTGEEGFARVAKGEGWKPDLSDIKNEIIRNKRDLDQIIEAEKEVLKGIKQASYGGRIVQTEEGKYIRQSGVPDIVKHPVTGKSPTSEKGWKELAEINLSKGIGENKDAYKDLVTERDALEQSLKSAAGQDIKERGFIQQVKESDRTSDKVRKAIDAYYNPITNKDTLAQAHKDIQADEQAAINEALNPKSDITALSNAKAIILAHKLQKEGNHDMAINIIEATAAKATELGQAVQALSLYSHLTPEGVLVYAQRKINQANQEFQIRGDFKSKIKMTKEMTDELTKMAEDIKNAKDDRDRIVKSAILQKKIAEFMPPTIWQKISTIQTMSQLLNVKTTLRNLIGNIGFMGMENIKDSVAAGFDMAVSGFTGVRTKTFPNIEEQWKSLSKGWKDGYQDALYGINTGSNTKFDFAQRKIFTKGILNHLETTLNVALRAPDRAFYAAAHDASLLEQMKTKGVNFPTDEMLKQAHLDGLYRTFQDDSALARVFTRIKKGLNAGGEWGFGDLVIKYPKTPANIISRGIEYTPLNFINTIWELGKLTKLAPKIKNSQDKIIQEYGSKTQRRASESFGRALTGSSLLVGTGYLLSALGLMTGTDPKSKDPDLKSLEKDAGIGKQKINTSAVERFILTGFNHDAAKPQNGDVYATYDWFQPQAINLALGANLHQNRGVHSKVSSFLDSLLTSADTIIDQPLFMGIRKLFGFNDPIQGITDIFKDMPASFVPTFLSQTAKFIDNTARNTHDENPLREAINRVQYKIPLWSGKLEPRITVWGEDEKFGKDQGGLGRFYETFISPYFTSKRDVTPEAELALDIWMKSGIKTHFPKIASVNQTIVVRENGKPVSKTVALEPKNYVEFQRYIGHKTGVLYSTLENNESFLKAAPDDQAKYISNYLTDIVTSAKILYAGHKPKKVSKKARNITLNSSKELGIDITK